MRQAAILNGYRSGLEDKVAGELDAAGHEYEYEQFRVSYSVPSRLAKYTPDFIIPANGIVVETKGRFLTADRQKHLLIQKEHPNLDIRFVFSNANTRISKQSATTYAMWCRTHDFQFANKSIPSEWLSEAPSAARMEALTSLTRVPVKKEKSK